MAFAITFQSCETCTDGTLRYLRGIRFGGITVPVNDIPVEFRTAILDAPETISFAADSEPILETAECFACRGSRTVEIEHVDCRIF